MSLSEAAIDVKALEADTTHGWNTYAKNSRGGVIVVRQAANALPMPQSTKEQPRAKTRAALVRQPSTVAPTTKVARRRTRVEADESPAIEEDDAATPMSSSSASIWAGRNANERGCVVDHVERDRITMAEVDGEIPLTRYDVSGAQAAPTASMPTPAPRATVTMDESGQITSSRYVIPAFEASGGGAMPDLSRIPIEPIHSNFQRSNVDQIDQLRPPFMARVPTEDVEDLVMQELALQQRRELILSDPRVIFVRIVSDLTNTRFDDSSKKVADAVTIGVTSDRPAASTSLVPNEAAITSPLSTRGYSTTTPLRASLHVSTGELPPQRAPDFQNYAFGAGGGGAPPAVSLTGGARAGAASTAAGQPLLSQMTALDMAYGSDPNLHEFGTKILRREQQRDAQVYVKRVENTGLVLLNTSIDTAARSVYHELKAVPNNRLRGSTNFMDFIMCEDESIMQIFAEAVAANINLKNGGLAPRTDVLNDLFRRTKTTFTEKMRYIVNKLAYEDGRIVYYSRTNTSHGIGGRHTDQSVYFNAPQPRQSYATMRELAHAIYVPPP